MPSIIGVMTQETTIETRQQRAARERREAADRARDYRQRHKEKGIPLPRDCDSALAEAIAFRLQQSGVAPGEATIAIDDIVITARRILVTRGGFDRVESTKALVRRIAPREEHTRPSFVPSINPPAKP
jgi:hypothetical protein